MDPFTQRMLEKAEQRNKILGINKISKHPYVESAGDTNKLNDGVLEKKTQHVTQQTQKLTVHPIVAESLQPTTHIGINANDERSLSCNMLEVIEKTVNNTSSLSSTERKFHRQFSAVNKENMDLGIEINIVTNKDMEVEVQVEEQNIANNSAVVNRIKAALEQPSAKIRDTSRSRLQRLGALYANPNDLSSPIHRTEGDFHSDSLVDKCDGKIQNAKPSNQRLGKLVELASSINQWEDDTTHHDPYTVNSVPPRKPDLPSRKKSNPGVAISQGMNFSNNTYKGIHEGTTLDQLSIEKKPAKITQTSCNTKLLAWDPILVNSLEAQGFQRCKSSVVKLAYDYSKNEDSKPIEKQDDIKNVTHQPKVAKLASTFSKILEEKYSMCDNKERKFTSVNAGLVSGRTAAFEKQVTACKEAQKPQKDPTELSLKERMQLFERNKGEALIPKAALGMAPSISKIQNDHIVQHKGDGVKATSTDIFFSHGNLNLESTKPSTEINLHKKVDSLASCISTTAESKGKSNMQQQRHEDIQVIANRFHKQKCKNDNITEVPEVTVSLLNVNNANNTTAYTAPIHPPSPPPPPPMPNESSTMRNKRHSPSEVIEEESKRARKSAIIKTLQETAVNHLYPVLSDLESKNLASESDRDSGATTATISGHNNEDKCSDMISEKRQSSDLDSMHHDGKDESDMYSEKENDSSSDVCNISLGREIMQAVKKNDDLHQKHQRDKRIREEPYVDNEYYGCEDSSFNSSETSLGINDYLDEALDEDGNDDATQGSDDNTHDSENIFLPKKENKGTTASNSFSFHKSSEKYNNCKFITEQNKISPISNSATAMYMEQPVKSEMSINRENDNNMVTLVHTVSFYRRQQSDNSANSTPIRKVSKERKILRSDISNVTSGAINIEHRYNEREMKSDETYVVKEVEKQINILNDEIDTDDTHLVEEKIKKLLNEVCKQQTVIAQTSQALNLCAATIEFSGSTESVEGERHLLVATHRRQACLDEIQRLRIEKCLRPVGSVRDKGRLTVKEITIPLRQDYIRKLAADTISGHHLVCLLKYNEYVLATKTVPTLPGLLAVKFPDVLTMNNVYADFRITLEIYGMTAQREVLPHEVKYHINLNKKCGIKTPKKKSSENRLVMPPVQSPAGPNVVRTPALVQYGFAIFSLREIQRTSWSLTQVLGVSPLEGVVHMKANCELSVLVEHRGFLTMFEDISGFGAWHRRWCYLNGSVLNYWKYPDDERKKTPIGTIDLYACHTQKVTVAPRDICARLNTILLEYERPAKETDVESLIIVPNGRNTIVRYLLSADTKDERELWCAYFNKVLLLLRAWGPPQ